MKTYASSGYCIKCFNLVLFNIQTHCNQQKGKQSNQKDWIHIWLTSRIHQVSENLSQYTCISQLLKAGEKKKNNSYIIQANYFKIYCALNITQSSFICK